MKYSTNPKGFLRYGGEPLGAKKQVLILAQAGKGFTFFNHD